MGSFAYSLHAKCDDPDRVTGAIRRLLEQEGWQAADSPPGEPLGELATEGNRRAFLISAPVYGWVGVLDSDLAGAYSLAPQLADQLRAYTMLCFVNDSDSWSYVLHRDDGLLDEFDSAGEVGEDGDLSDAEMVELGQTMQQLQAKLTDGSLQQEMQRMSQEVLAQAPAEMQALHARIQQGQASREEVARYRTWELEEAPKHTEKIQQFVSQLLNVPALKAAKGGKSKKRKRKPTKAERAAAQQRADNLRPLFVAGTTDEQFQEVLAEKAAFAEAALAKFLPLVGIPGHYAFLSYDYHSETTPEELNAHGIRFAEQLQFESAS